MKVDAHGQSVRGMLTDSIPLAGYAPILWNAETQKRADGSLDTTVQFYGDHGAPKKFSETRKAAQKAAK